MSKNPWNWSRVRPSRGGLVEMDAVPMTDHNHHVVTRGMFKLAAYGVEAGTFAVLNIEEAKIVRDRIVAWLAAMENE